jgi:hypothetical protein
MDGRIIGFAADELGEWIATLDCFHRQHVRHRPPFRSAPWVLEDVAREQCAGGHLGMTAMSPRVARSQRRRAAVRELLRRESCQIRFWAGRSAPAETKPAGTAPARGLDGRSTP